MYKRRYHKKRIMFAGVFSFMFAATFAFLSTANQDKTEAASTANFKAGNIISDAVMTDYNSMTVDQIHAFLKSKNSCNQSADPAAIGATRYENVNTTKHGITYNRRYFFRNSSGGENSGLYHVKDGHFVCMADETINGHSAAYVIWDAAQAFKINPKVLIVLLEKEQSLVTDKWPYEVQYRAATGYGCPDSAACDSKYYGLEAQVGNAAYLFGKIVYENKHNYYPVGKNYVKYHYDNSCGGSVVNIENRATGALYTYTPYQPNAASLAAGYGLASGGCGAYGNRNFFLLYSDWFGDPHSGTTYNMNTISEKLPALSSLSSSKQYQLNPSNNAKSAIDISGGVSSSSKSGTLITYQKRNNSIFNQSFVFKYDDSEKYYYIENPMSGLRFDVSGASSNDGTEVLLWTKHIGCNQKWTIKEVSGKYVIISSCSNKALTSENGRLVIRKYTGASNQLWDASEVPANAVSFGNGDKYQILNVANSKLSIDLSGGVHPWKNNYEAIVYEARSSNNANQVFSFQYDETNDAFRILNPATGLSLDVTASKSDDGTRVLLWQGHSHCNQKWKITKDANGVYNIKSLCNSKPLSALKTNPNSMDSLVIFNRTDNSAKWQIKKV